MEKDGIVTTSDTSIQQEGFISQSLSKDGIPNQSLPDDHIGICLLYTSPSPRDKHRSRMPSSA